jgi:beta-galactosidase
MITQLGLTKERLKCPNWNGRHVFLHFEGGTSAMYIWINVEKSRLQPKHKSPTEFDITKYVKSGKTMLLWRYTAE